MSEWHDTAIRQPLAQLQQCLNRMATETTPSLNDMEMPRLSSQSSLSDVRGGSTNLCCPSALACVGSMLCFPAWIGGCVQVNERQSLVIMHMGKYVGTSSAIGCMCVNPCCREIRTMTLSTQSTHIEKVKIADANGNPLLISSVVTFKVVTPVKASLDVNNYETFLRHQALVVMKRIASMYPFEAPAGQPSLKTEAGHVAEMMISFLQEKAMVAGLEIISFDMTDLSFAPEVAQGLLVRQQAEATLAARTIIAKGATLLASETLASLSEKGVEMDQRERARLASNLLLTILGESKSSGGSHSNHVITQA